jgi:hypothetical protein
MAAVQYTFTHKQCTEYRERNIHHNKKKGNNFGIWGPCPVSVSYTLAFVLQRWIKHRKTSIRIVKKCPDIPVTVVPYTFTHKQYTKQHIETEYTERSSSDRIKADDRERNNQCQLRTIFLILLQATKAIRKSRGLALLCFLDLGTRRGQRHAPTTYYGIP